MHKLKFYFTATVLLVAFSKGTAGTVYQDTFSADGSLAGRAVEVGSGTWIARPELMTTNGVALPGATNPGKNALLPFTAQPGMIYTLSADIDAISGSWEAIGFLSYTNTIVYGNELFYSYATTEAPWMSVAAAGNLTTYSGPSSSGAINKTGLSSIGTMSIVLDTTGSNWVATYYYNSVAVRTNTFSGSLNIHYVGFGGNPISNITVDNFKLESRQKHTVSLAVFTGK